MWPGLSKLTALLQPLVRGRPPQRPAEDADAKERGQYGEDVAVYHLREMGYKILDRNVVVGRGEIDVLALDAGTVCFVEVKARTHGSYGMARLAGNPRRRFGS